MDGDARAAAYGGDSIAPCRRGLVKRVADILGHRSIDTTAIYAKVALDRLAAVALPWPGSEEVQS